MSIAQTGFTYPFFPKVLKELFIKSVCTPQIKDYANDFILQNFVSWMMLYRKTKNYQHTELILSSLLLAFENGAEYNSTAAFLTAIEFILRDRDFTLTLAFLSMLRLFLEKTHMHNKFTFSILVKCTANIFREPHEHLSCEGITLLDIISDFISDSERNIQRNYADSIINILTPTILNLQTESLVFLKTVLLRIDPSHHTELFGLIPHRIVNAIINDTNDCPIPSPTQNYCSITPLPENARIPIFPKNQILADFPDQLKIPNFNDVSVPTSSQKALEAEAVVLLSTIKNEACMLAYVNGMFNEMEKLRHSPRVAAVAAHIVRMCSKIFSKSENFKVYSYLLQSIIFDPSITYFDNAPNFDVLGSIRQRAVEIILTIGDKAYSGMLRHCQTTPALFTEIIFRVSRSAFFADMQLKIFKDALDFYIKEAFLSEGENSIWIRTAILGLIAVIEMMFENREIREEMFNDPAFLRTFMQLVYFDGSRKYALDTIIKYCSTGVQVANPLLAITSIFPVIEEIHSPESARLYLDLCDAIVILQKVIAPPNPFLSGIIDMLFDVLHNLVKSEDSKIVYNKILYTLSDDAHRVELESENIAKLLSATNTVFEGNYDINLYHTLCGMMMASRDAAPSPKFILKRAEVLRVMFRVFLDTPIFSNLFDFISKMCSYSKENCRACHDGKIDDFLLDLLNTYKSDSSLVDDRVKAILEVFKDIACIASSPSIVKKFISLLTPTASNNLPRHYKMYISTLNEMLKFEYKRQRVTVDLGIGVAFVSEVSKIKKYTEGFTTAFWINQHKLSHTYFPILSFNLSDATRIQIGIQSGKITFEQIGSDRKVTKFVIDEPIHLHMWTNVAIHYKLFVDKISVVGAINGVEIGSAKTMPMVYFAGNDILLEIGGLTKEHSDIELGTVSLYRLLNATEAHSLYETHPLTGAGAIPGLLMLVNPRKYFEGSYEELRNSFPTALVKQWRLDLIIPLFSQITTPFDDGTIWENSIDYCLQTLSYALQMGPLVQNVFVESNHMSAITWLLFSLSPSMLTYHMYLRFFSLFLTLSSPELKMQLFEMILANPLLWCEALSDEQLPILKHWGDVLFKLFSPHCQKAYSFQKMIVLMQNIYSVKRDDIYFTKRVRAPDLDINQAREYICDVLLIIAGIEFTPTDFIIAFGSAFSYTEVETAKPIIFLLSRIFHAYPEKIALQHFSPSDFALLHLLINLKNNQIFNYVIDIILQVHRSGILDPSMLCTHLNVLTQFLSYKIITKEFFEHVVQMMTISNPELLPICSWYAANSGDDVKLRLAQTLNQVGSSPDFVTDPLWMLWPAINVACATDAIQFMMIQFLQGCEGLIGMMEVFDIVCPALGLNRDETMSQVVKHVFVQMQALTMKEQLMYDVFQGVASFLFIRVDESPLTKYFNNSPFGTKKIDKPETPLVLNSENVTLRLKKFCETGLSIRFGLRIDDTGDWIDVDLAKQLVSAILRTKAEKACNTLAILLVFIARFDPKFTLQTLCRNDLIKIEEYQLEYIKAVGNAFLNHKPISISIEIVEPLFNCVLKGYCNSLENRRQKIYEAITKLSEGLVLFRSDANSALALLFQRNEKYRREVNLSTRQMRQTWSLLWSSLSVSKGPWVNESRLSQTDHWRRDSCVCFTMCPFKMKKNTKFIVHQRCPDANFTPQPSPPPPAREKLKQLLEGSEAKSSEESVITVGCKVIKVKEPKHGEFRLFRDHFEISLENGGSINVELAQIKSISLRTRMHLPTAFEIILYCGKTYFIDFMTKNVTKIIVKIGELCSKTLETIINQLPTPTQFPQSIKATRDWVSGKISNFEYLMRLNIIAGRSFSDQSQYPIFPWVLADYTSSQLDLNNPLTFRDLTKPMGAIGEDRLEVLKSNFEDSGEIPYLYSSGPVSTLSICLLLLRIEPFSSSHVNLQGGHFDNAGRLISSLRNTYKMVSETANEYWELVPEFFFMPEILTNDNNFDFGVYDGNVVNNIELPPYAKTPMEFIYLHRKALESNYITTFLPNWIDLMFGYKQRGPEALKADNVYMNVLYDDIWLHVTDDNRDSIEPLLNLTGQIPPQIFLRPHPRRKEKLCQNTERYFFGVNGFVMFKAIVVERSKALKMYGFTSDGMIVATLSENMSMDMVEIVHSKIPIPENSIISNNGDDFVIIYGPIGMIANTYRCEFKEFNASHNITSASICKSFLSTTGDDATTDIYGLPSLKRAFRVHTYRDVVTCTTSSEEFKVQINGTRDGGLIVISLTNGETVRVIDCGGEPILITVTPSWGFIVACVCQKVMEWETYFIVVFNINGIEIRRKKVDNAITTITSWTSSHGFDYLLFVEGHTKAYVCEAFYLNFQQLPIGIQSNVAGLCYLTESERIAIIEDRGKVTLISYTPDDLFIQQ